jgi:hypothetical protein
VLSGAGTTRLSGAHQPAHQLAFLGFATLLKPPPRPPSPCHCSLQVVVVAKTTEPAPTLPGTIYTVAKEVEELGVRI